MAEGFKKIPRVVKGDVSLVAANYANEIIDLVNLLGGVQISPTANVGTAKLAPPALILDLSVLDGRLKRLEDLLYVNGVSSLENRVAVLEGNVTYLNNRMNNATISGNGSCSGNNITINVSLNI